MYQIIQTTHSYLAALTLLLLLVATVNGIIGANSQKAFEQKDASINRFALMAVHTMFLLGLTLLVLSPKVQFSNLKATMSDPFLRLYTIEHPFMNLIAVALVTIGFGRSKRAVGNGKKFKQTMIFFGLAFVIILSRIPWQYWFK
ncbi:hypothetical protein [Emticicia sp. 17c]|uniref:hypothetical protein n=1 Tax=Emticicia sp. 17c TaxID=3127704 RepID=UPI00301D1D97